MLPGLPQLLMLFTVVMGGFLWQRTPEFISNVNAFDPASPAYGRFIWWMVSWESNTIVCSITIQHEGLPSLDEVREDCGNTYTNQWLGTPPCDPAKGCDGYYLHMAVSQSLLPQSTQVAGQSNPISSFAPQKQVSPPPTDICAEIWQIQPPTTRPNWLSTPERSELLATKIDYYYLAARLIAHKIVDASACPAGGLRSAYYANECGMDKARPVVLFWQNQFDRAIFETAMQKGIPAQLLKNLFAQESQFWPGTDLYSTHFGLGQATELGIDALFIWNPDFYNQYCPLILSKEACSVSYVRQSSENKAILRGYFTYRINVDCPECPYGIDMEKTFDSVSIFADLVVANCHQVAQIVNNATDFVPGSVASYEDLWRFTLANYHVGPGCVSFAIFKTWDGVNSLTWDEVNKRFTETCSIAIKYVENIAK